MEILATEDVTSVTLFTIKISESEMQAYESWLSYVLDRLTANEIEALTGHTHDFSPRLKPGVSWVRTKQETPNALPTPLAPPFLPIAKARGISEDLGDELEDVHEELLATILAHCPKQFLPERYKF